MISEIPSKADIAIKTTLDSAALSQVHPINVKDIFYEFVDYYDKSKQLYANKRSLVKGIVKAIGPDAKNNPAIQLSDSIYGESFLIWIF